MERAFYCKLRDWLQTGVVEADPQTVPEVCLNGYRWTRSTGQLGLPPDLVMPGRV